MPCLAEPELRRTDAAGSRDPCRCYETLFDVRHRKIQGFRCSGQVDGQLSRENKARPAVCFTAWR